MVFASGLKDELWCITLRRLFNQNAEKGGKPQTFLVNALKTDGTKVKDRISFEENQNSIYAKTPHNN